MQIKTVRRSSNKSELPILTQSLCPQCLDVIDARLFEQDGRVYMEKTCIKHGNFSELISSDADFFLKMRRTHYERLTAVDNPQCVNTSGCPHECGICDQHLSTPAMVNIDLTNRCNLRCPICFANAAASQRVYDVNLSQLEFMLDKIKAIRPYAAPCLQYVGGEPTIHPDFITALQMAKDRDICQIQVATNGIRFAAEYDFARRAADAGLRVVYLQFDGVTDDIYKRCRGRALLETKLKAIENLGKAGIRIVLVPTIVKGLNDHQLGDITRFAIERADILIGISWQPVAITGRIDQEKRLEMRFTLADLARCLEEQTGIIDMHRDWFPFSITTPLTRLLASLRKEPQIKFNCDWRCGCATYLIVDMHTKKAVPLPAIVDIEGTMKTLDKTAKRIENHPWLRNVSLMRAFKNIRKYFNKEAAPEGWEFEGFVEFIKSFIDLSEQRQDAQKYIESFRKERFNPILMSAMHFQDCYNYDIDRCRRCIVHYIAPNGRFYPFCTWNSGPCHRHEIEHQFGKPLASEIYQESI